MADKIYKGFFSGTFGKGTFNFDWNDIYVSKRALAEDYRVKSLFDNNIEKIYTDNGFIYLSEQKIVYTGPFWSEKDDNNENTIYDCRRLCYNEIERIKESDFFVCVLTNSPSVGSVGELMTALYLNKPMAVFYEVNENLKPLSIPTRHWWSISSVHKINEQELKYGSDKKVNRLIYSFDDFDELYNILKNKNLYKLIMNDISFFSNSTMFNKLIKNKNLYY